MHDARLPIQLNGLCVVDTGYWTWIGGRAVNLVQKNYERRMSVRDDELWDVSYSVNSNYSDFRRTEHTNATH